MFIDLCCENTMPEEDLLTMGVVLQVYIARAWSRNEMLSCI